MKKLRNVIILSLTMILTAVTVNAANLGTLYYWASDAVVVGEWTETVQIYLNPLNSSFTYDLNNSITNAISQWSLAGINVEKTLSGMSAEVIAYGGTLSEIQTIYPSFSSGSTGLCVYNHPEVYNQGTYSIYGTSQTVEHYHFHIFLKFLLNSNYRVMIGTNIIKQQLMKLVMHWVFMVIITQVVQ